MSEHVLDAKGLNCPLPIIKAKKMLKDVPTGETLRVLATDPGSVADFAAFCRTTGNELVEFDTGRDDLQLPDQALVLKRFGRILATGARMRIRTRRS